MEWTWHQSRWMPEGDCDPMETPCCSRLLAGPVDPWGERSPHWSRFAGRTYEPTLQHSVSEGLHPVGRTHAGAVREELQPVGRTHIGEVCGGLFPVGGTPCWSRGREWGVLLLRRKELQRQCDELTATLIPRPRVLLWEEEVENLWVKLNPGRRERWREGVIRFSFYFSLSYSDWIGNKLN